MHGGSPKVNNDANMIEYEKRLEYAAGTMRAFPVTLLK